jgi:hypothetical protein
MGRGGISSQAQVIARSWIIASGASLLLPTDDRLGWWLPLHLALAGGATAAIAGAAPDFAAAISAGRVPRWAWVPVALFSAGTAAIGVGVPTGNDLSIAIGGTAFAIGGVALAAAVLAGWNSGVNRRHRRIAALYVFAALCPTVGATIGVLLATGASHSATAYLDLRRAHVAVNLAGFLSLTIVATSVLLIPTVLRARAPSWRSGLAFLSCASGLVLATVGLAMGARILAGTGAAIYAIGTILVLEGALRATRPRPKHPERAASLHLLLGLVWLAVGSVLWTTSVILSSDRILTTVVVVLALGTVVQSLIGAWSHLTPMSKSGGPDVHRGSLARADMGARSQVLVLNVGVGLAVAASAGAPTATASIVLVVGATLFALAKTASIPPLDRASRGS